MPYIFGPVPSRRLGLSLGVDLIPFKTCTYDCIYCQVGRTTRKTIVCGPYVPMEEVIHELKKNLRTTRPDTITLAGSGEPTLNSQIKDVIGFIKSLTGIRVAVITNGSLLWKEEIRDSILEADIIMPTLTGVDDGIFKRIHRPCETLELSSIIQGLKELRNDFRGSYWLEVMLLAGINDSPERLEALRREVEEISPDRIQLNSVERPPSDSSAVSLDARELEKVREMFGEKAEIISSARLRQERASYDSHTSAVMDMVRRRPVSAEDISSVLDMDVERVRTVVKGLLIKGIVQETEHGGRIYYTMKQA